jgi:hypothetical protein
MKTRKRIMIFLIILVLLNINVSQGYSSIDFGTDTKNLNKKPADSELENVLIELNEEIPLDVFSAEYNNDTFESIEGIYRLNNETITFGFNNYDNLKTAEAIEKIKAKTMENVKYIKNTKSPIFSNYKKSFKVNEVDILKTLKVKKVKMKNEEFVKVKSKLLKKTT